MQLTRLLAYQIAANPHDIVYRSHLDQHSGMFAGIITRGPQLNHKLIFSTEPVFRTPKDAKRTMSELARKITAAAQYELANPESNIIDPGSHL